MLCISVPTCASLPSINWQKRDQIMIAPDSDIIREGQVDAPLYTLLSVGRLHLADVKALARIADLYGDGKPAPRPLI